MVVWYYAKGGERRGPMPWSEFRDAARAGAFGPDDLVWTPGYGSDERRVGPECASWCSSRGSPDQ